MFLTLVVFLVILSILVFVHEMGHFLTARFFGVRAEEFGMGLPPRLFGFQKIDGRWKVVLGKYQPTDGEPTIYSLNLIPIGGFVKIKGENGEEANETDSFGSKKIWQRNLILVAGVTMNVLLCAILLSVVFMIGVPGSIEGNERGIIIKEPQVQIIQVLEDSPAEKSGLMIGDIILQVNEDVILNSEQLKTVLLSNIDNETDLSYLRLDEERNIKITPINEGDKISGIGVGIAEIGTIRYPWYLAIWQGIKTTWLWLVLIFSVLFGLIKQIFGGAPMGVDFAGPVGIAVLTGQAVKLGLVYILQFTALLSLNLAIINILPFPALDGGRILFLTIGKIRGKMIDAKWENVIHNLGFMLLMVLIIFITYRDILKYGSQIISVFKGVIGI